MENPIPPYQLLSEYLMTAYADKEPTLKQYKTHFKRLYGLQQQIDLDNDDKCIECINETDYTTSQKLGLLNLLIIYRGKCKGEIMDKDNHPLVIYRQQLRKNEHLKKLEKNEQLKTQLPTREMLHQFMLKEYDAGRYKNYIVNYMLLHFYCRNVDCNVKIFKNHDPCVEDYNYLVFYQKQGESSKTPEKVIWKRNVYKTKEIYGKQEHIIRNRGIQGRNFCNAVARLWEMEAEGGNKNELRINGVPLLKTLKGEQVSNNACGWYVANCCYQALGEGKYLKVILNDINNKPNTMNILNMISNSRGTGAKHLITDYNITQSVDDLQ